MKTEKKGSLLIVDDENANIYALTQILGEEFVIYAAKNGQDALEVACNYTPDVILLDILMPDMDGYEVLSVLKRKDLTKDIPVIFITGLSNCEAEEKGLALGASDYISKPFSSAIVKLRVRNQIQILNQIKMIRNLSLTDLLTDLPNRRGFDYRMQLEWDHAKRNKTALSILIIDIDNFKNYNDMYGHLQGDAALKSVANSIMLSLNRSIDFVARWGGEEFFVLLPTTDMNGAFKTAELIRKNVEETPIPYADEKTTKVTISTGVNAAVPCQGGAVRDFIDRADQALYFAKKTGKNKAVKFDEAIFADDVP